MGNRKGGREFDPLSMLVRNDKWYLGNGGMLIYAPTFPENLDTPGFWDECHYGDLALHRLLCVSFALEYKDTGVIAELQPKLESWEWQPHRVLATYRLGVTEGIANWMDTGIHVTEQRSVSSKSSLHCALTLEKSAEVETGAIIGRLHVVAWTVRQKTALPNVLSHSDYHCDEREIVYTQDAGERAHARGDKPLPLRITMSADRKPDTMEITPSHGAKTIPELVSTPFWDSLKVGKGRGKGLSGSKARSNVIGSTMYAGMHWRIKSDGKPFGLGLAVSVEPVRSEPESKRTQPAELHISGKTPDPEMEWREFLSLVPHFECDDESLTRYYWYRWYGIRLNSVPRGGNYVAPAVTEGIAYFRGVVTYSLMCHMFECKWLSDPSLAQGCLKNHIARQTKAGHFPGHIYLSHVNDKGFYHTDVGRACGELFAHHPDARFEREIYMPLKRLLEYYERERDKEKSYLYDIRDQFETGQEFTSRYFFADTNADLYGWEHKLKMKGVDVTVYVYHLARYLAGLAAVLGKRADAGRFARLAGSIRDAVRDKMWDAERRFFFDYDAGRAQRSPYMVAVGYYPLLSDIATPGTALDAAVHLFDKRKFGTEWQTPTVPADDPYFSADPRWRGERANCPWNGRVWPMVNSHICEVYGGLAEYEPEKYRPGLAAYLRRFIEMMHFEKADTTVRRAGGDGRKDLSRPNCFEHYNPADGTACEYRGIDDYMHSWVSDLILKYVAGVRVSTAGTAPRLVVDPFPFGLSRMLARNMFIAGRKVDVCIGTDRCSRNADGFRVYIDGKLAFKSANPCRWECEL